MNRRRLTLQGTLQAGGGLLALALLVCGCVFAAIAGPAESVHTRTQALQQTFNGLGAPTKAVEANTTLTNFRTDLVDGGNQFYTGTIPPLTLDQLEEAKSQLYQGLSGLPVPLAPDDWAGLASRSEPVSAGYARGAYAEAPPRVEVLYRDTLTPYTTVVAGQLTAAGPLPRGTIAVSVTAPTAARFGLRPGSRMKINGASVVVTGIVRARDTGAIFWQFDATALAPSLQTAPNHGPSFWEGALLADPDQLDPFQNLLGATSIMQWEFPLALGGVNADQAQALYNHLNNATAALPALSGDLQGAADNLSIGTGLLQPLSLFLSTQASVLAVLLLLFVSVIVVGAAVIVLAARMIADRREDELVILRARGASARQLSGLLARGAALAAIPAAAAGGLLAIALVPGAGDEPGGSAVLGWTLAGATLLLALAGPPLIGTWRHRRPGPAANPARITTAEIGSRRLAGPGLRRLVAEVTACGAAVAGLIVLHGQGVSSAGSTNWYLTIAPVLAAIPAVLVVLRLYPLVISLLLRITRRRAGATSYIALAASARTSLATAGPAFALVLALTVTAFAGMVTDAINAGQVTGSWQATGADAVVNTSQVAAPITPAVQRTIAAVPGVRHETAIWTTTWTGPAAVSITAIAVDPVQYTALTAATPFPRIPAGVLSTARQPVTPSTVINVLASPSAAAALRSGTVQLSSVEQTGPIEIHVAGTLTGTPAQPGGGMFIVMPLQALPGFAGTPAPNTVLITGTAINQNRLSAVAARALPGSVTSYRSDALASLRDSPLQHGALLLMLLSVFTAAGFGLLNLILGLALGATDRDLTFARLNVMGYAHGGALAMAETLPAILAAAVAGLACALVLPALVGGSLDLSVFTYSGVTVTLKPGYTTLGLPAAAMLVLAVIALAVQTRLARRRGATGLLRAH